MSKVTGYNFLNVDEDNWDDLTYEEQQQRIEDEKQKLFKSLDDIEQTEYKTQSDVATYIRNQSLLEGDYDKFENLPDEKVVQFGQAMGMPIADQVYEPTAKDIASFKSKELQNRLYNMDAYGIGGFNLNLAEVEETKNILNEGIAVWDDYIKNNPKARATSEWLGTNFDTIDNPKEFGKYVLNLGMDVGSSVAFSATSAKIGGFTGGTIGSIIPGAGTVVLGTLGAVGAGAAASSTLMGGSTLRSEYERLQQDSQLTGEQFLGMVELAQTTFNDKYPEGNFYDEQIGRVTNKTELLNSYLSENFEKVNDDLFIMKGMSEDEAIAAATGTANWSAAVGALIEQISLAGKILKLVPGIKNKKFLTNNIYTRMNDKVKNKSLLIRSQGGTVNRVKAWAMSGAPKSVAEMAAEATEEVLQGFNDAFASTYTPMLAGKGIINGLEEMYYPPTDFSDHHGGWTQLRDEIFGGILGSSPGAILTAGTSITTIGDRIVNKNILKKSETQEGIRYAVEKGVDDAGKRVYNVVGYSTTKEKGKKPVVEKLDISKLKDKDGETLQTSFSKFDDAFNVADTYTKQEAANLNQINAWRYRDIRNGSTKVVKNDDGTFSVEVYDNEGNLFQKDEETYNKKYKANRRNKELSNIITDIGRNYTKYKLDNIEDNDVINNYERTRNNVKAILENNNQDIETSASDLNTNMGIAAFMMEKLPNTSSSEARELYNEKMDETTDNPDNIINIIKNDTDNNVLTQRGHTPEKILTAFDETFGPDSGNPIPNFDSKRNELNSALYPQGAPTNQNKAPKVVGLSKKTKPPEVTGPDDLLVVGPGDITVDEGPVEGPDIIEEGPPQTPVIETPKPPKGKKSKSLKDTPINTINKNIEELKAEIPTLKEGTTKRTFAEKRLSLLEKEIERRKTEEKKAPSLKDISTVEQADKMLRELEEKKYTLRGKDDKSIEIQNELNNIEKAIDEVADKRLKISQKEFSKKSKKEKKSPTKKKLPLEVTDEAIEGISPKEKKINQTLDVAERLFKTFDGKINLDPQNLGAREPVAKYDPNTNTVILNLDSPDLDIDAPFHEFSHPFISMLAKDKPELFNSIYEEAIAADNTLLENIKFTYRNEISNGQLDEQGIREEVIAHTLDRLSKKSYQQLEALNKKNPLRKLWTTIKRFFNYIMDKYGIKKVDNAYNLLTPSTTLKEISDILVNYDNKYIIDMGDKAFQDETIEIATKEGNIASVEIAENETEAAVIAEENAFIDYMTGRVRSAKSQKALDKAIDKLIRISNKRFPYRKNRYTGSAIQKSINTRLGTEGDVLPSNRDRFIAKIKSRVIKGLPKTVKLNKKHIEKLVRANETISEEIQFRFRFVNNEKLKDPNGTSNIKDLHTWPGIRKGEKENIKEFAKTIKVNSMKNIDIINAYILYTSKKLNLSYVVSKNYSDALNYRDFFPELAEEDIYEIDDDGFPSQEARPDVHRVLIVKDRTYTAGHSFPELKVNRGKFESNFGSPLGWYTVAYGAGRVLLHEFQSDVLMETLNIIQRANLNKGQVKVDAKKPIPNLLGLLQTNTIESTEVIRTLDNEKKYADDPINNLFRADALKIQVGFESSIFEGIPYDFKLSEYQFEFNMDYSEMIGHIVDRFISQFKQDIVLSDATENKITLEHVKLVIDRLVDLNKYVEYSEPKVEAYGLQPVDMFVSELDHELDNLKSRKYNQFQELKIQKHIMEVIIGYGNYKPHTNQERADLLEFYSYYAQKPETRFENDGFGDDVQVVERLYDIKDNEDVFINFPNKKNSFYRFLLQLDNQQRTPEYSKPQFIYDSDSIYSALKSIDMLIGVRDETQLASEAPLQISNLINNNGKPSAKSKEYRNKLYLTYRDISSYLNDYIKNYVKDRNKIENYEAIKTVSVEARPIFLKEVLKRYKYYNQEYTRKLATIALLSEFANSNYSAIEKLTGKEEALDLENVIDNIPELVNAKKELSVTDNWFENLIMHGILHSNASKPGKEIYINTGSAISLIEGNDAAMSVYASKKEHQWRNLHTIINKNEKIKDDFINEIIQWYSNNKEDFKNPKAIRSSIEKLKATEWQNSLYAFNNTFDSAKTIAEAQDMIIDFAINKSKNNIFLQHNINHKLSQKVSSNSIEWGNKSIILDIDAQFFDKKTLTPITKLDLQQVQELEITERINYIKGYNKTLEKFIKKEFANETDAVKKYLYNQHAIFDRLIVEGIFKKALDNVNKDKLNGVKIELVYPEWSSTALYKVTITDDKKLVPVKWKKKLETIQNSKDLPQSVESLEINLKNKIELQDLNVRSEESRIIKGFFDSAWRNMNSIAGRKKVDIEEFKIVMNHVIDEQLVPAFEQWWENKFATQSQKASRLKAIGKDSYVWFEKNDMNIELQQEYTDWAEGSSVSQMLEKGVTSEKTLSLNDLVYFKALKTSITQKQLDTVYIFTRRTKTYNEWKDVILRYLNVNLKITTSQNEELIKIYNRVKNSTLRTNRDGDGIGNQRDNLVVKVNSKWDVNQQMFVLDKLNVFKKGPVNEVTKNDNNKYEKITLFEANHEMGLFTFIGGGDVLSNYSIKDEDGNYIKNARGESIQAFRKKYGFFKKNELERLEAYLRAMGYTIAFSRGDSDTLGLVKITDNHKELGKLSKSKEYWKKEFESIVDMTEDLNYLESILPDLLSGDTMDRAATIAIHEGLKKVFPKYLLDKNPANVYKRIKIPFTPVTISKEMPPIRIDRFDPNEVKFVTRENPEGYNAIQDVPGLGATYIGDGNTLSSQLLFDSFNEHHGLAKTTAKAKTVIYHKDVNGATALKHQHVLPMRNLKIVNKNTNEVLYKVDNDRYITDANGNAVHVLATDDEIKIGSKDVFAFNTATIPGKAIGFIKFDESSKQNVKHIMQWYNYVQDPKVISQFIRAYGPVIGNKVTQALNKVNPDDIKRFMRKNSGRENTGFALTAAELAEIGAGTHPSLEHVLNVLIQTQAMLPALNLDESIGSIYDVSMDVTGTLKENEISLAIQNSQGIKTKIAKKIGKPASELKISEINRWLENNEIFVMVTRSPVAYAGGAYMARVRRMHSRRSLAELNVNDLRLKLEGDGDGDEVHVELLDDQTTEVYKDYMDSIKANPLNLNRFKSKTVRKIFNKEQRIDTISSLIAGQIAIAEIANVNALYGMLGATYNSITINNKEIKIKKPTDKISFPEAYYDGVKGGWSGTVEEYLRIWLQAAVDNNEFGLLYDWNYNQNMLIEALFEGTNNNLIESIKPMIDYYKKVLSIRRGANFEVGNFRLDNTLEISEEIFDKALDRSSFDIVQGDAVVFKANVKNIQLTPYELVAVAPYRMWQKMSKENNMFGYDGTPYRLSTRVHRNAHKFAREQLELQLEELFLSAKNKDLDSGVWDGTNEKEFLQQEVIAGRKYIKGTNLEPGMGVSLYRKLKELKQLGPQTIDRNDDFIAWKEKWDGKFKDLSQVAKVSATVSFLRGYLVLNQKLDQQKSMIGKMTQHPKIFPSVSKKPTEVSLLDAGMIEYFFKKYHEYINLRDPQSLNKLVENSSEHVSLIKSVMKICGE